MKVSCRWLEKYTGINDAPENIARLLTNCGLEVESIQQYETVKGGLIGVVAGKVLTCKKHPNADQLTVTTVDTGGGKTLTIVCGAPNVQPGQNVVVATVGSTLHAAGKTVVINKTKIRGVDSEGMICAEDELGIGSSHAGIMVLDPAVIPGTPAAEIFNVVCETVLEIGITPNRSDALSYIGIARDLVAAWNAHFMSEPDQWKTLRLPENVQIPASDNSLAIEVTVEDHQACKRYSGITIRDVTVKESPQWLKDFLLASNVRPINNIVDITNFVLLEMGQPLHAFDAQRIAGNKVIVKKLAEGTPFITLDHIERKLTSNDLMICNSDEGMCIAGVFGGITSAVNESTKSLFIESACFDPTSIRRTSKYHGLKTDASFRFERGSDPNITVKALERATALILDIAGGIVASEIQDIYPFPVPGNQIRITYNEINNLIGNSIDPQKVQSILHWLGITICEKFTEGLVVEVSPSKPDVTRPADLIEEILRIYGYNNIDFDQPLKLSVSQYEKTDRVKVKNTISDWLSANGFYEIMCNSLTKESLAEELGITDKATYVRLLNPISRDLNIMRQTLIFGALETVIFNINRKITDMQLYEFGTVYTSDTELLNSENPLSAYNENMRLTIIVTGRQSSSSWYSGDRNHDFYSLKNITQIALSRVGVDFNEVIEAKGNHRAFAYSLVWLLNNKPVAELGRVSDNVARYFDIGQDVFIADIDWEYCISYISQLPPLAFDPLPKYPEVNRDLALLLDKAVEFSVVGQCIRREGGTLLKHLSLFDVYQGGQIPDGKKSYAVRLTLQNQHKTLTDDEVAIVINRIATALQIEIGAVIR